MENRNLGRLKAGHQTRIREVGLIGVVLALVNGCASDTNFSRITNEPAPLAEDKQANFGRIALIPPHTLPNLTFSPDQSAGTWAERTFDRMDAATRLDRKFEDRPLKDSLNYYDVSRLLITSVAAGTAALAEEIFSAVPKAKLQESQSAVQKAFRDEPLLARIDESLRDLAQTRHCDDLVALSDQQIADLNVQSVSNLNLKPLAQAGIGSVLFTRLYSQSFGLLPHHDPPVVFVAAIDVYVISTSDGSVLHFNSLEYRSRERKFTRWGENNAARFREELKRAGQTTAEAIFLELFRCARTQHQ